MVIDWQLIAWIVAATALLGVYPITYLAYRGFVAETHQERLKDDFRLLGLVDEDELDATVRGLYQTAYNPWQFISYILLILLLAVIILVGYLNRSAQAYLPAETITLVFFSFLGAYTFSIQELVRRYNTFDLQPQVYSSILMRMLVAIVITFAGASLLLASGGQLTGEVSGSTGMAWAAVAAFVIGVFPSSGMRWIQRQANRILSPNEGESRQLRVRDIQGISDWHEARLQEMGIDDVQNLATVDIRKLLLTTRFDTQEIINWIDQAILYSRVGDKYPRFKDAGITTYHELCLHANRMKSDGLSSRSGVERASIEEQRKRLSAVLGLGDPSELDFLCDYSNHTNYVYIAEYYLRSGRIARQRASAGMGVILGPHAEEKDFERAIEELKRQVRHNPQDGEAFANLGIAYFGTGRVRDAIKTLDRAINLNPNSAIAYTTRARIFLYEGKYKDAIGACHNAIRLDSRDKHAYNYRAKAYVLTNQVDKAIEDFNRALEVDDRFADAYLNRGLAYNMRVRFADAKEDFEAYYLLGDRRIFELWLGWGTALLGMGRYPEAIARLSTATSYERPAAAYSKRGYAYLQINEIDKAREDMKTAINLDNTLWEAYDNLGLLEHMQKNYDKAVGIFQQTLQQVPKRYTTRYNLGMSYYRQGKLEEARKEFKQVMQDAPSASVEALEAQKILGVLTSSQTPQQSEAAHE